MFFKRQPWAVLATVIMSAGSLVAILGFFGIKSAKDLHMTLTWPQWTWLVFACVMLVGSIGVSVYSLLLSYRDVGKLKKEISELKQSHSEGLKRLNIQHESEEYKSRQIRDEALAESRAARAELNTAKEQVAQLETQLADAKKHAIMPPDSLPVQLVPTTGPNEKQFLILTNKGERERFHAQCVVFEHSSVTVRTSFDLGWESGGKHIYLAPEESCKLLIARAWDDSRYRLEYRSLCEFAGGSKWNDLLTERWDMDDKPNVTYQIEIRIFGDRTHAVHAQQFIVRPGETSALEMYEI